MHARPRKRGHALRELSNLVCLGCVECLKTRMHENQSAKKNAKKAFIPRTQKIALHM